jgi:hypothetical protein
VLELELRHMVAARPQPAAAPRATHQGHGGSAASAATRATHQKYSGAPSWLRAPPPVLLPCYRSKKTHNLARAAVGGSGLSQQPRGLVAAAVETSRFAFRYRSRPANGAG